MKSDTYMKFTYMNVESLSKRNHTVVVSEQQKCFDFQNFTFNIRHRSKEIGDDLSYIYEFMYAQEKSYIVSLHKSKKLRLKEKEIICE